MRRVSPPAARQLAAAIALFVATFVGYAGQTRPRIVGCGAPEVVCQAAENQGLSLYVRDRCRYEQRLLMERYEYDKATQQAGDLLAKRETVVVVEPAPEPDETGRIPVVTRVVADTDDRGNLKEKVDPNARTGLASQSFLDQVFFPLLPEDVPHLAFEEVTSETEGERWFKFSPRPDRALLDRPLASGIVRLDAKTGEVLTIDITALSNLKALDGRLDKIVSFRAKIDYSQFGGRYRLPTAATGGGVSEVSRFKGYFKFTFEEGKYAQVMGTE